VADRKKEIFEDDLIALVEDETNREHESIQFVALQIVAGTSGPQTAELTLSIDGEEHTEKVEGNGPVDAIFKAIRTIHPHEGATLQLYQVHAVTGGTDAQAEVTVRLAEDDKTINGQGADADTLVASARAYVNALNKLLIKRESKNPQTGS
jgi:2-isopropylmalate synthase